MKKLELLMSVMHQKNFTIPRLSKVNSDLLVVNQCDECKDIVEIVNGHNWRMISTLERGSSKSRNMAIDNAHGEICKLCDDDETLVDDYEQIILNAYEELPDADVIVFNVNRINYRMKKTYYRITSARIAPKYRAYQSSMITFRLKSIREKHIRFNELFGSGVKLGCGEDSLFVRDMRNANLKIYEHPAVVTTIDYGRFGSKWFHGYDEKYFYNQGAYHEYSSPRKYISNIVWGLYQYYKLRREHLSIYKILKWRLAGAKGFRNGKLSYEEYTKKNG